MNLKIREFSQAIINFTNESSLPIEVKRLVLREILDEMKENVDRQIKMEIIERESSEMEGKPNGNEQSIQPD